MIGCWPTSFSRLAASVEKPVFVFFCGTSPSSSNSTWRSCGVELTLKSWPAASTISWRRRSQSATSRSRRLRSSSTSTPTPTSSMRASTPTSGTSISSLSVRRPCASSAACSGATRRSTASARRPAIGAGGRGRALEVELAVGRRVALGDAGAGVADRELLEEVAGLGRVEEVGGQRRVEGQAAHVDAEPGERPHQRLGLVGGQRPAVGAAQLAQRVAHRRRRPAARPGTQMTAPLSPSVTRAMPSRSDRPSTPCPARRDGERRGAGWPGPRWRRPRPPASSTTSTSASSTVGLARRRAEVGVDAPRPAGRTAC